MVGASPTLCCLLIWPFHTGRISKKNNSHPSLSKTGTFFKVPPRSKHTHTHNCGCFCFNLYQEYIWTKHSYFSTPTPQKRQRILSEIELFMKCESIESIFHFVQKHAQQPTRDAHPRLFHPKPSQQISPEVNLNLGGDEVPGHGNGGLVWCATGIPRWIPAPRNSACLGKLVARC